MSQRCCDPVSVVTSSRWMHSLLLRVLKSRPASPCEYFVYKTFRGRKETQRLEGHQRSVSEVRLGQHTSSTYTINDITTHHYLESISFRRRLYANFQRLYKMAGSLGHQWHHHQSSNEAMEMSSNYTAPFPILVMPTARLIGDK